MDPKISPEMELSHAPPSADPLTPEVEVWEPPFERWMKMADVLLGRVVPPLRPKPAVPLDSKILKQ